MNETERWALHEVQDAFPDARILLVGARALDTHIGLDYRVSDDIDLALDVEQAEFPGALLAIAGWTHSRAEHRFRTAGGVALDILPTGSAPEPLVWPSGYEMSLRGFDLAFESATVVRVEEGLHLLVPSAPALFLLKVQAYLDRPNERQKDVEDIEKLLERYLDDLDERHWSDEIIASGIVHDMQSAYALGLDLRGIVRAEHEALVKEFLAGSPEDAMVRSRFADDGRAKARVEALRRGFFSGQ